MVEDPSRRLLGDDQPEPDTPCFEWIAENARIRVTKPHLLYEHLRYFAAKYLEEIEAYREDTLPLTARRSVERKARRLELITLGFEDAYDMGLPYERCCDHAKRLLEENGLDVSDRVFHQEYVARVRNYYVPKIFRDRTPEAREDQRKRELETYLMTGQTFETDLLNRSE